MTVDLPHSATIALPDVLPFRDASPTLHHTLNKERSARFTAQHLSALLESYFDHARAVFNLNTDCLIRLSS